MLCHFLLLLMSYCAVFKAVEHIPFYDFSGIYRCLLFVYVYCLIVCHKQGLVLFLWLSAVICVYTECPITHRHLSGVCSVFTYIPYSWHTTEYLQCDQLYTLHNVCFRTVHLCLSVVTLVTRVTTLYKL